MAGVREESAFWIPVLYSLQTTQFIAIGRIFDTGKQFSFKTLRTACLKNIGAFSREALQIRKGWSNLDDDRILDNYSDTSCELDGFRMGMDTGWKRDYIENAYEISSSEINMIFDSLSDADMKYKLGAKIARDEVFAHAAAERLSDSTASFEGVVIGEFRRMLDDLYTVHYMLHGAFLNGQPPVRMARRYRGDSRFEASIDRLCTKIRRRL